MMTITIATNYADANVKANEYLYRRVDMEDVVSAHLLAMEKAHRRSDLVNILSVQRHLFNRIICGR